MLIFPLKKEWYDKIKSGEKTVEYREAKPYWARRITSSLCFSMFALYPSREVFKKVAELGFNRRFEDCSFNRCKLRLGYRKKYMTATITKIEVVNGKDTDLHIDKPVYAIHLVGVKEICE